MSLSLRFRHPTLVGRTLLACGVACLVAFALACQESGQALTVYKTPTCGCCSKWIDHMKAAGFEVAAVVDLPRLDAVKAEQRVPAEFEACHTAVVDGYVVEGHVPASDVRRLLEERPRVRGLAVPGMPIGSPGMEGPRPERYTVYAFDDRARPTPFATHGP